MYIVLEINIKNPKRTQMLGIIRNSHRLVHVIVLNGSRNELFNSKIFYICNTKGIFISGLLLLYFRNYGITMIYKLYNYYTTHFFGVFKGDYSHYYKLYNFFLQSDPQIKISIKRRNSVSVPCDSCNTIKSFVLFYRF